MQLAHYVTEIGERFKSFLKEKQLPKTTKRCCIRLLNNELSFIYIDKSQTNIKILGVENILYKDEEQLEEKLSELVEKYQLQNIPIYWLLTPEEYQLFLIESLPVEQEELRDAMSWRIRNLTQYPPEEVVSDFFVLPPKQGSNKTLIAAVAAPKTPLSTIINLIKKTEGQLTVIDISELALKNLTAMLENDEKSTAFIYFYKNLAILNITFKKTLYFTRRLNLTLENESITDYEQISLDILRYFDYFQSQWRQASPNRIFIADEKGNASKMAIFFSKYLLRTVEPYPLSLISDNRTQIEEIAKKDLLTLGCALRGEDS